MLMIYMTNMHNLYSSINVFHLFVNLSIFYNQCNAYIIVLQVYKKKYMFPLKAKKIL